MNNNTKGDWLFHWVLVVIVVFVGWWLFRTPERIPDQVVRVDSTDVDKALSRINDLAQLLPLKERCRLLAEWGQWGDPQSGLYMFETQSSDGLENERKFIECSPYLEKVAEHYKIL